MLRENSINPDSNVPPPWRRRQDSTLEAGASEEALRVSFVGTSWPASISVQKIGIQPSIYLNFDVLDLSGSSENVRMSEFSIGKYDEIRNIYTTELFAGGQPCTLDSILNILWGRPSCQLPMGLSHFRVQCCGGRLRTHCHRSSHDSRAKFVDSIWSLECCPNSKLHCRKSRFKRRGHAG